MNSTRIHTAQTAFWDLETAGYLKPIEPRTARDNVSKAQWADVIQGLNTAFRGRPHIAWWFRQQTAFVRRATIEDIARNYYTPDQYAAFISVEATVQYRDAVDRDTEFAPMVEDSTDHHYWK